MPLVFQYGSNCDASRLNHPDRLNGAAKDLGRACTVGTFELAFNKWSETGQCAAADMIGRRKGGRRIWGVLYEMSSSDLTKLAADVEGPSYKPKRISIANASGVRRVVTTFVVRPARRRRRIGTTADYVAHIVNGLRDHGVPEAHVKHVIGVALANNTRASAVTAHEDREIERLSRSR